MPADYKSYNRNKKKRGAKSSGKYRWWWTVIIIVIILLFIGLYWLSKSNSIKIPLKRITVNAHIVPKKIQKKLNSKPVQPEVKFEFYNLLPKERVVVPGKPSQAAVVKTTTVEPPIHYMLQVASLKHLADANTLSGQLSTDGFATQVNKIIIKNNVWYRVQVGPFNSLDDALDAQSKLRKRNDDAIIKKIKA